jgi:hypothetical protein
MGAVPEGYTVNHFLTDTNAWFLTTDVPNGMKHFVSSPLQNSMDGDFRYRQTYVTSLESVTASAGQIPLQESGVLQVHPIKPNKIKHLATLEKALWGLFIGVVAFILFSSYPYRNSFSKSI